MYKIYEDILVGNCYEDISALFNFDLYYFTHTSNLSLILKEYYIKISHFFFLLIYL